MSEDLYIVSVPMDLAHEARRLYLSGDEAAYYDYTDSLRGKWPSAIIGMVIFFAEEGRMPGMQVVRMKETEP